MSFLMARRSCIKYSPRVELPLQRSIIAKHSASSIPEVHSIMTKETTRVKE
jgi:hypothetical protein